MMNIQNNKMINIGELIDNCFNKKLIYIPLLQRNYKWDKGTASKLASDLLNSFKEAPNSEYTIGMITLYQENEKTLQLIDGQQRVVTLTLILKCLKPERTYLNVEFERDEGVKSSSIKRSEYLKNINNPNIKSKADYTDLIRFNENYEEIKKELKELKDDTERITEFINYILNNVDILFHVTNVEPTDEFLNINKNKTRFVISDHIKANLMIDTQKQP